MKCSELIKLLDATIAQHGDLEVGCLDSEFLYASVAKFTVQDNKRFEVPRSPHPDDAELGDRYFLVS